MKRRDTLLGLAALACAPVLWRAAHAQRRLWRIAYHSAGNASSNVGWLDAFRKGMGELGWSEANHYVIDARYSDGDVAAFARQAAEIVATRPDVILAVTDEPALGRLTKTIPIVFALGADPVANGYAASLHRPGGNATGVSALTAELAGKRLQLLKEAFPQISHVTALFQSTDAAAVLQAKALREVADQLKLKVSFADVREASDIDAAFKQATPSAVDAYVVVSGFLMNIHRKAIAAHLLRARLPSISSTALWAEAGILLAYAPSAPANFRRTAAYVDKILKGAKPGDLPIEQPTQFDLVINARTAKALGWPVPASLRLRADRVIE